MPWQLFWHREEDLHQTGETALKILLSPEVAWLIQLSFFFLMALDSTDNLNEGWKFKLKTKLCSESLNRAAFKGKQYYTSP